jgi:hypothetical protein
VTYREKTSKKIKELLGVTEYLAESITSFLEKTDSHIPCVLDELGLKKDDIKDWDDKI